MAYGGDSDEALIEQENTGILSLDWTFVGQWQNFPLAQNSNTENMKSRCRTEGTGISEESVGCIDFKNGLSNKNTVMSFQLH